MIEKPLIIEKMVVLKKTLMACSFIMCILCLGQKAQAFRPMTFEEMMAPVAEYQRFVNQCLGSLAELLEEAETIEPYIDRDKDPQTWRRYTNYYNSVVNEYNSIRSNGTNQGTRNRISNLHREFKVITGIKQAYNRRNELSNTQFQRLRSTGENCNRYYSEISLDEFLDGQTPSVTYY